MATRTLNPPETARTLPVTERVLNALPGPRTTKLIVWGALPLVRAVVQSVAAELGGFNTLGFPTLLLLGLITELVMVYSVLHAIHGTRKLVGEMESLEPTLVKLVGHDRASPVFRGLGNAAGPLAISAAVSVIFAVAFVSFNAWGVALIGLPFNLAIHLPLASLVWTYLMLATGLDRLGRENLPLETYDGDRGLGLRPVGRLAFAGFWTLTANLGPVLLVSISSVVTALVTLAIIAAVLTAFFWSLNRLHQQMMRARRHQLARARELYTRAYAPLVAEYNLETLREQSPLLGASEALEKRAETIQTWPFEDRSLRLIAAIVTSVVIAIITRLVMRPLGL